MKTNFSFNYDDNDFIETKVLDEKELILQNIKKAKTALDTAYANFDFVTEPELIDSYIYELKSIQLKYKYLLQKAKELGIIAKGL